MDLGLFEAREHNERSPLFLPRSGPACGLDQRDAGPSVNVRWIYGFSMLVRAQRTPTGHEGNGEDITSVSPTFPPNVVGRRVPLVYFQGLA